MPHKTGLITLTDPRSSAAEGYRTLRTNLMFAALDKPIETLIVTTAAPHEEKLTPIANLAVAMAQGERRTILVDADLRRPGIHTVFDVSNEHGLTSMILDAATLETPPLVRLGIGNLWLLPSGPLPPNPADLLGSRRMEQVIAALKARADIVLFNAPPVIAVTDTSVLGTKVDGVLLVTWAGRTRREHVERAKELLERVHVRLVGAVLADAPRDVTLGGY